MPYPSGPAATVLERLKSASEVRAEKRMALASGASEICVLGKNKFLSRVICVDLIPEFEVVGEKE